MTYVTGHSNISATTMDLSAPAMGAFREAARPATRQKWPLWWTVLGVTLFCATFWTAFFSILF